MLEDPCLAYEVLTTSGTGGVHSTAATMLQGGFLPWKEPHLYDMLLSIRTSQLEDLISKTRIYVPNGRWLLGCMDETGLLNYGQCFIRVSGPVNKGSLGGDGFNQGHRSGPLQVRRYLLSKPFLEHISWCSWCSGFAICITLSEPFGRVDDCAHLKMNVTFNFEGKVFGYR